jgi:hypothetical protein
MQQLISGIYIFTGIEKDTGKKMKCHKNPGPGNHLPNVTLEVFRLAARYCDSVPLSPNGPRPFRTTSIIQVFCLAARYCDSVPLSPNGPRPFRTTSIIQVSSRLTLHAVTC